MLCALALGLSGCFYLEATAGQLALINQQKPLARAIEEEPDAARAALLREVPDILAFAHTVMSLDPGGSYRGYVDVHSHGLTHVLVASEKLRFEPYRWWFPFAGSVEYKSFFEPESADEEARSLMREGYDVYVGQSRAYSTLGYLRDPVTNTMLEDDLHGLVEVLFHELAHRRLYVPSATAWNEQFATFVATKGCERYFARPRFAGTSAASDYGMAQVRRSTADALIKAATTALTALYASGLHDAEKLRRRETLFRDLARNLAALSPDVRPSDVVINNARLLQFVRYADASPELEHLWRDCRGNFACFYARAEVHGRAAAEQALAEAEAAAEGEDDAAKP